MSERHLPDDQSSTIDPYLITSVRQTLQNKAQHYKTCLNNWIPGSTSVSLI